MEVLRRTTRKATMGYGSAAGRRANRWVRSYSGKNATEKLLLARRFPHTSNDDQSLVYLFLIF